MAEHQSSVIDLLKAAGFTECGHTSNPTGIVRIPGNRYVATAYSYRIKLCYEDRRVTVGVRTTCLYRVKANEVTRFPTTIAYDFQNFKTRDVDAIAMAIANIKESDDV